MTKTEAEPVWRLRLRSIVPAAKALAPVLSFPLEARVAQPPSVVQGQGLPAELAEADVVPQAVEQNLVDLVRHLFPAVVEPVLVHRAVKGLGKGEIKVQLPVVQLQLRQGGVPLRKAGLLSLLP